VNQPCYKDRPIASLTALGKALGIPWRRIQWAAWNAERLYRPGPSITKPDGSEREVFNPARCLKEIQRRINKHILERVEFPLYLQGGIKDPAIPRDYIRNARMHVGAKGIIREDIANFFPSVTDKQIREIWQYLFTFPSVVADCLTALTTYQGRLPQGAPTSTYLANLVLCDIEPQAVARLKDEGFRYSRYVDDITISSRRRISGTHKQLAVRLMRAMCKQKIYRLKNRKHRIESAAGPMHVHSLIVNDKVSLPRGERSRIRAAVHRLSNWQPAAGEAEKYLHEYNRVRGRVANLARLHPGLGQNYKAMLNKLIPANADLGQRQEVAARI
jgi:hypothetical protein